MKNDLCVFCLDNGLVKGKILYQDELWYYQQFDNGEVKGGGMIITTRHIKTPFEINEKEWSQLHKLLPKFKSYVDEHDPDGYNIGWNIGEIGGQHVEHAHLHIFPRFKDEPLATKGIRHFFKLPQNKRKTD